MTLVDALTWLAENDYHAEIFRTDESNWAVYIVSHAIDAGVYDSSDNDLETAVIKAVTEFKDETRNV